LLPHASPFSTMQVIAIRTARIETTIHMDMDGDIQYIWVFVECFLNAVTFCRSMLASYL